MAKKMADATGLPPYRYESNNAVRVNSNPTSGPAICWPTGCIVCPVVYVEPYVMNNKQRLRPHSGGRLRWTEEFRRLDEEEYLPRICGCSCG